MNRPARQAAQEHMIGRSGAQRCAPELFLRPPGLDKTPPP